MNFDYTPKVKDMQACLFALSDQYVHPNEHRSREETEANRRAGNAWIPTKVIEELKPPVRKAELWNLFLPHSPRAPEGPLNLEYTSPREIMGRVPWVPEVFNCSAPDIGSMETLERYASEELKDCWPEPLLRGEICSASLMTESAVASSDATNIERRIECQGDEYVINGRKWWPSDTGDPHRTVHIVMGKTNPDAGHHEQQSTIMVPANAPGITVMRPLSVFGYDNAPCGHMGVDLKDVHVPVGNILLGEGRGSEIAQGRLGPGCIHHCMRSIGVAECALELMYERLSSRIIFGKAIAQHSVRHERTAEARCMIEQTRLLTLKAVHMMDTVGNKVAKAEIAMIKVVAPNIVCQVVDWAIQAHGGGGASRDFLLASAYAHQHTLHLTDGLDGVHCAVIAKLELARHLHLKDAADMSVTYGA